MSGKQARRMAADIAMTVTLLLLMGYSRICEAANEVLGVTMFVVHYGFQFFERLRNETRCQSPWLPAER